MTYQLISEGKTPRARESFCLVVGCISVRTLFVSIKAIVDGDTPASLASSRCDKAFSLRHVFNFFGIIKSYQNNISLTSWY